jgi:hypothetical protein
LLFLYLLDPHPHLVLKVFLLHLIHLLLLQKILLFHQRMNFFRIHHHYLVKDLLLECFLYHLLHLLHYFQKHLLLLIHH